jgi:glycine cleavage system H protein
VAGEVVDVNTNLASNPSLVNSSPYDEGWMVRVRISDRAALSDLMDATKYRETLGE